MDCPHRFDQVAVTQVELRRSIERIVQYRSHRRQVQLRSWAPWIFGFYYRKARHL